MDLTGTVSGDCSNLVAVQLLLFGLGSPGPSLQKPVSLTMLLRHFAYHHLLASRSGPITDCQRLYLGNFAAFPQDLDGQLYNSRGSLRIPRSCVENRQSHDADL